MEINDKGNKKQLRQGDLLFVKLDKTWQEEGTRQSKLLASRTNVIAAGEATGHNHTLTVEQGTDNLATLFFSESGVPVVVVEKGEAQVVHEEHDAQTLEEGSWVVIRQVEYTPDQRWRTVMD